MPENPQPAPPGQDPSSPSLIQAAWEYAQSIVDTVREPLLVLRTDLRVQSASRSFYRTFRVTPEETEGCLVYELGSHQWDIPALRRLLEDVLPRDNPFHDFEVAHDFPAIGHRVMLLNARLLKQPAGRPFLILLAIEDVTERDDRAERQRAEGKRRQAEEDLRLFQIMADHAGDAIFLLNEQGRFLYGNATACRSLGYTPEQFRDLPPHRVDPAFSEEAYRDLFRRASSESLPPFETWHRRADGSTFPVEAVVRVIAAGDRRMLLGVGRDITERRLLDQERERLADREHNIVMQLQEALQPGLPGRTPGLALTRHYEPALAEAGVGGDFYDVYAVEKGCTALVVADLSGKGLAAAAQVATVRHMLRAFLYSQPTLSQAVTALNEALLEYGLITGFATLFVGLYDARRRVLTYVNCGQEPALVRRAATGLVEELHPTGPILGVSDRTPFRQESVALSVGDAVAVFTDGLTEVGPSRREMLGAEGVARLLRETPPPRDGEGADEFAEALALRLIGGVDAFAHLGVVRDDVCLLVGVAE